MNKELARMITIAVLVVAAALFFTALFNGIDIILGRYM